MLAEAELQEFLEKADEEVDKLARISRFEKNEELTTLICMELVDSIKLNMNEVSSTVFSSDFLKKISV